MSKLFNRELDGYPSSEEARAVKSNSPYWLHLRWIGSDNVNRYKIEANQEVIDWLDSIDPNRVNWWPVNGRINVNEVLYLQLVLKFR